MGSVRVHDLDAGDYGRLPCGCVFRVVTVQVRVLADEQGVQWRNDAGFSEVQYTHTCETHRPDEWWADRLDHRVAVSRLDFTTAMDRVEA